MRLAAYAYVGEHSVQETGRHGPIELSPNARVVLEERYLRRDDQLRVVETPEELFWRVARAVAQVDARYSAPAAAGAVEATAEAFFAAMAGLEFLPNTPTLMNAGTDIPQCMACFVLPVEDSLEGIFDSLKLAGLIQQTGGGTGFAFSRLRPRGDVVRSTKGVASGPVSFMAIFNAMSDTIKQGSKRRGANMGVLRVDHPDIREFITCKRDPTAFTSFNISIGITDAFMQAVDRDAEYDLINPRTGSVWDKVRAREIWDLIVENAWESGEPGLLALDTINRRNPTRHLGDIEATNPCGEEPLHPYEACCLGSINLSRVAPTGTISLIANCSSGIEPLFALAYVRHILGGKSLAEELHPVFREIAQQRGFYSDELLRKVAERGSIQDVEEIPEGVRRVFVTAMDVDLEWHVRMQAAFQRHTDNGVSKTINAPPEATVADVDRAFRLAYQLGAKGITVYRYGSRPLQVLSFQGVHGYCLTCLTCASEDGLPNERAEGDAAPAAKPAPPPAAAA